MAATPAQIPARQLALLALAYAAVAFLSFQPALSGGFVSDDALVVRFNPFVQELSAENLVAVFDPTGPAVLYALNSRSGNARCFRSVCSRRPC